MQATSTSKVNKSSKWLNSGCNGRIHTTSAPQNHYITAMTYVLHYAPDNASLIIRLALDHAGIRYRTQLVDRAQAQQTSDAYLALNPHGLIPTLETPHGPLFETGAILLWLADTHGGLGPAPTCTARGDFLKWLFYTSNTVHPALRMLFYPEKHIDTGHRDALRRGIVPVLQKGFAALETQAQKRPAWLGGAAPTVLDFYVAGVLRWPALYPKDANRDWFDLTAYPALFALCARLEKLPCCVALCAAEGMQATPFTNPSYATPPEGCAT